MGGTRFGCWDELGQGTCEVISEVILSSLGSWWPRWQNIWFSEQTFQLKDVEKGRGGGRVTGDFIKRSNFEVVYVTDKLMGQAVGTGEAEGQTVRCDSVYRTVFNPKNSFEDDSVWTKSATNRDLISSVDRFKLCVKSTRSSGKHQQQPKRLE